MNNAPYKPISCSYYDRIEGIATTRSRCEIVYLNPLQKIQQTFIGFITDVYAKNEVEYLVIDTDEHIRLDYLVSINGIPNPSSKT